MTTDNPIATQKKWQATDIKEATTFLRSLHKTGMPMATALAELANLQPDRRDFWQEASRHAEGRPLHTYLQGHWPDQFVTPIEIAENSGKLNNVLQGIEKTLKQQRETTKLLKGFRYPAAIVLTSIPVFFFLLIVMAGVTSKMKGAENSSIIQLMSVSADFVSNNMIFLAMAFISAIAITIHQWQTNPAVRLGMLEFMDGLPTLGYSTRWLYYSTWANYVSIMHEAGQTWGPILATTANVLPEHLRASVERTAQCLAEGQTLTQAATPTDALDDPRRSYPAHIVNAFRMTDTSGGGDEQFKIASDALYEPALESLAVAIKFLKDLTLIGGAIFAFSPMVLYMSAMGAAMQNMR